MVYTDVYSLHVTTSVAVLLLYVLIFHVFCYFRLLDITLKTAVPLNYL